MSTLKAMKPAWATAPDWAQWLAMDSSGQWCWYSIKPIPGFLGWTNLASCVAAKIEGWNKALEKRPAKRSKK